jgi:Flp pilus assembly protein TadG
MTMRFIRFFHSCQKGAAGAEMALMLPLLVTLMFGSFELSNYFWTEHKVVKGVRDGARFAARLNFTNFECPTDDGDPDTPPDPGTGNLDPALETQIKEVTRTGLVADGTATVADWVNGDVDIAVTCPDAALDESGDSAVTTGIYANLDNAPIVTVSTTVSYNSLFETLGFDATELSVSASSQSAVMGF